MSLLLIEIPPRPRLATRAASQEATVESGAGEASALPTTWRYVFSPDGANVGRSGQVAMSLLPRAETVVAMLAAADISWHRLTLPRTGAARMNAALAGALEEALLDDTESVHFALAPKGAGFETSWVAATQRGWLAAALSALESGGLSIDRVVPGAEPAEPANAASSASGHFTVDRDISSLSAPTDAGDSRHGHDGDVPLLTWSHGSGVVSMRLSGSLPRQWITTLAQDVHAATLRWTATPAAAAAAERWLGAPVAVLSDAQHALQRAASAWNLRQFDLVARHRGTRMLREAARRFFTREWRLVRWGLAALVAVQLVGLNAYAWQQQRSVAQKRDALDELLRTTHPQVRAVLDAPLQMQRETEVLRSAAGRAGEADLETLLAAAATAWPDGVAPLQALRFESGRLSLSAPGLDAAQLAPLRERLKALGFGADWADGRMTITRGAAVPR